eukprot:6805708-Prorocentrum_lima.AAC.1
MARTEQRRRHSSAPRTSTLLRYGGRLYATVTLHLPGLLASCPIGASNPCGNIVNILWGSS